MGERVDQAVSFVTEWRTNTGWTDLDPLPFDYRKELIGARTPCLLGQDNLLPTARKLGWRYDASSPGGTQIWPEKRQGLWDLPLQGIPFPGHSFEVLSMDYNILANQSKNSTQGMPSRFPAWREQAIQSYLAGFERAYGTNRAPFYIGNHFEVWNGGIYMDAVEETLKRIAGKPDVRLVSFRQFVDWLDVQDPAVLAKLRTLEVGESPAVAGTPSLNRPDNGLYGHRGGCARSPKPPCETFHMSFGRAPRRRFTLLAAPAAAAALALTLTACGGDGNKAGGGGNSHFVTGSGGISTVAKADRKDAPKLDGATLDGQPLDVADYKGKVVVLNVWGSWCGPCRLEAKHFAKVSKETASQGVQFIGINTRDAEKGPAVNFEKDNGITYPSFFDPIGKLILRFPGQAARSPFRPRSPSTGLRSPPADRPARRGRTSRDRRPLDRGEVVT